MYQLSDLFLAPVLVLLVALFAYSLFAIGGFSYQAFQRRSNKKHYAGAIRDPARVMKANKLQGYPLIELFLASLQANLVNTTKDVPRLNKDQLDVAALKELEMVRTVSRLAPMLGLIATMVPMGPALKSLADGNVQGISENLIVAFSAVIFGLVIASITFWIATIKKRWLATELVDLLPLIETPLKIPNSDEGAVIVGEEREAA